MNKLFVEVLSFVVLALRHDIDMLIACVTYIKK